MSNPLKNNEKRCWIIKFKKDVDPKKHTFHRSLNVKCLCGEVYHGMICSATKSDLEKNLDPNIIESFEEDSIVQITALKSRKILGTNDLKALAVQPIGPFISRIGTDRSSQKVGDGQGSLENRKNINVFVVDTGIALHGDLNVVGGRNFTSSNPAAWKDENGHGTHVAGIIGAKDNSFGIVGVAPGVRLWAVRVLGSNGNGSVSNIMSALKWILEGRGSIWTGFGIVNMSLGGNASAPLDTAVNNLINNGLIVCAAAGNNSVNVSSKSPARVLNAITVGATGPNPSYNTLASYSNYGSIIDILAPGSNIYSTYLHNNYASLSGTSMACPVVSGTVALMLSTTPITGGNSLAFVKNVIAILITMSSYTNPKCYDGTTGKNPRISVPPTRPSTGISIWSGSY